MFQAHLVNPSLAESVIRFCAGTAYWLTQQLLAGNEFNDGKHREIDVKDLPDEVSMQFFILHFSFSMDCLVQSSKNEAA